VPDPEQSTGPVPARGAPAPQPTDDEDGTTVSPSETSPLDAVLEVAARDGIAVVATDAGRVVFVPQARYDALTGASDGTGRGGPVTLTPREAEILSRVARGDGTAAISTDLGVAVNTVAQHLVAVRRKYGVRSSTLAVEAARRDGLLQAPGTAAPDGRRQDTPGSR
jgi:DNA-binding CsgD family transcriptional regulator